MRMWMRRNCAVPKWCRSKQVRKKKGGVMGNHTAGPWTINAIREHDCDSMNRRCQYDTPDGLTVCSYSNHWNILADKCPTSATVVADIRGPLSNARLIAAAPDMLEALDALLRSIGLEQRENNLKQELATTVEAKIRARLAIEKARGA